VRARAFWTSAVTKIWREFVGDEPEHESVAKHAGADAPPCRGLAGGLHDGAIKSAYTRAAAHGAVSTKKELHRIGKFHFFLLLAPTRERRRDGEHDERARGGRKGAARGGGQRRGRRRRHSTPRRRITLLVVVIECRISPQRAQGSSHASPASEGHSCDLRRAVPLPRHQHEPRAARAAEEVRLFFLPRIRSATPFPQLPFSPSFPPPPPRARAASSSTSPTLAC
jgi:hypothetical protein